MKELSELLGLQNRKEAKREEQIARERAEKTRRLLEDAERIIDTLGDTPTTSDGEFYTRTTQVAQTDTPTYNSTGIQEYVLQELLWYDKQA